MFDLGWTELLVIGIVALIVVGPKDLPILFRRAGQFVGRLRGMAREFTSAMNEAADQAGVSEIQKGLKAATNPVGSAMDSVKQAAKDATKGLDPTKYDPESETGKLAAKRAEGAKAAAGAPPKVAAEGAAADVPSDTAKDEGPK